MSRSRSIVVVNIVSPSYTGTTWLNLVLGCHAESFALGPPDRVWELRHDSWDDACRVHGAECPFWPTFHGRYDAGANFYLQLAEAAQRRIIVINNPGRAHEQAELTHPDIVLRQVRLVRDGRAVASSYARQHDVDFYDAVTGYVRNMYRQFPYEPDREDVLTLHYEKLLESPHEHLPAISAFIGLDYPADAFEFWRHEHHVTTGNAGTLSLLKMFQGIDAPQFRDRARYEEQFERMRAGGQGFRGDRWQEELGQRERYIFDYYCGEANQRRGYEADRFTTCEHRRFSRLLAREHRAGACRVYCSEFAGRWLDRWRRWRHRLAGRWRMLSPWPPRVLHRLVTQLNVLPRRRRRLLQAAVAIWLVSLAAAVVIGWLVGKVG